MALVKICPSCGEKNDDISLFQCKRCEVDISGISPVEDEEYSKQKEHCLIIKTMDGHEIRVNDGDVVGRNATGKDVLDSFKTVSGIHAKFICDDGNWFIEDLNSTNGTYINGSRIPANKQIELNPEQKLSLSKSFKISVLME